VKLRWKLFLSHFLAISAVVVVIGLVSPVVAVDSITRHLIEALGDREGLVEHVRLAVAEGVTESMIAGVLAALAVAAVAGMLVSVRLTGTLRRMADAAGRIAAGEYSQRVAYEAEDEIGELARSFNHMAGRLEQTERLRRDQLADLSHELRTPLTSIQGYMEGLVDGVIPEEPQTYQLVQREAARLTRLVGDIERLSRVESGATRAEPVRVAPREVIVGVVERLRPQFEQKRVSLNVEASPEVPAVLADEDLLVQVLLNLVSNSFKYTSEGGHVVLRAGPLGEAVLLEVADDGVGIPAEDLPHVFERFYRVDKSRSAAGGGAGIGLTIAKSLIVQMGGHIWAESTLGQGTRVCFLLPAFSGRGAGPART